MIDVAHAIAAVAAIPGTVVAMPKSQIAELLAEVELGQRARRILANAAIPIVPASGTNGTPA